MHEIAESLLDNESDSLPDKGGLEGILIFSSPSSLSPLFPPTKTRALLFAEPGACILIAGIDSLPLSVLGALGSNVRAILLP